MTVYLRVDNDKWTNLLMGIERKAGQKVNELKLSVI